MENTIKSHIETCYLNGALNAMNTDEMRRGYHKDFAILFSEGDELKKLPLDAWIKLINDYKSSGANDGLRRLDAEFLHIEVTETAAYVKLNLKREGELLFTDYITLLKFGDSWKIVSKIYHNHVEDPWKLQEPA